MQSDYRMIVLPGLAALLSLFPAISPAGEKETAKVVAMCTTNYGVIMKSGVKGWETVKVDDQIPSGTLLFALPLAEFRSANGAVKMLMVGDIGRRGAFPVLESAVRFNDAKNADLDITLDRGIVAFVNMKEEGAATVKLRFRDENWTVTLSTPGTRVGMDLYSRHAPGLPKITDGKIGPPLADLFMLVRKGEASLSTGDATFAIKQPPGAALVHWNSTGQTARVRRLPRLPKLIMLALENRKEKLLKDISSSASRLHDRAIGPTLNEFLKSDKEVDRLVGVTCLGAVDDLPRLIGALTNPMHADVRDHAVLVLRHWMGRQEGHAKQLYETLRKQKGYSDVHAKTVVQLLLGFTARDRHDPFTYELLLAYLGHSKLAVRELARWHLVRFDFGSRGVISYDAAAPAERRAKVIQQWRQRIPSGKLPPPVKRRILKK